MSGTSSTPHRTALTSSNHIGRCSSTLCNTPLWPGLRGQAGLIQVGGVWGVLYIIDVGLVNEKSWSIPCLICDIYDFSLDKSQPIDKSRPIRCLICRSQACDWSRSRSTCLKMFAIGYGLHSTLISPAIERFSHLSLNAMMMLKGVKSYI